jgi:hypothetical protein
VTQQQDFWLSWDISSRKAGVELDVDDHLAAERQRSAAKPVKWRRLLKLREVVEHRSDKRRQLLRLQNEVEGKVRKSARRQYQLFHHYCPN